MQNLKYIIFTIVIGLFYNTSTLASNHNNISDILEQYAKELQHVNAKLESLEQKVQALEKNLVSTNENHNSTGENQQKLEPINANESIKENDVFSLADKQQLEISTNVKQMSPSLQQESSTSDKISYDLALATLKEGNLELAEQQFADFISKHSQSNLLSNAYFWYAESFLKRGILEQATINYLKSYKNSPKGTKASDALLKLATALSGLKKNKEACGVLAKLDKEFPSRAASSVKKAKDLKNKLHCE